MAFEGISEVSSWLDLYFIAQHSYLMKKLDNLVFSYIDKEMQKKDL